MTAVDMVKGTTLSDLKISDYKVQYFHPTISLPGLQDRQVMDLTDLVTSLEWDYSREQAARHATLTFEHHPNLRSYLGVGGVITVFGYAVSPGSISFDEIMRLFIITDNFDTVESAPALNPSIECYDQMWYLANNRHTQLFHDKKASDIIVSLCDDFGIKFGEIEDTGTILPRLYFRNATLYDMMITALTESRYIDDQRYVLYSDKGAIYLRKKKLPPKVFVFEFGQNLFSVKLSRSIADMKNRIRLYANQASGADPLTGIIDQSIPSQQDEMDLLKVESNDTFMQSKYGLLSDIVTGIAPDRYPTTQAYADHILSQKSKVDWKGRITGPNINTFKWGDAVYVYEPLTQMVGQFYVIEGRHSVTKGKSTMELTVHYEDALPENYFEKFENAGTRDLFDSIIAGAGLPSLHTGQKYASPVVGQWPITQEFGQNPASYQPNGHTGTDIGVPEGTYVYASNTGKVTHAGPGDGPGVLGSFAGTWISMQHEDGVVSIFAHLSEVDVLVGQNLNSGDVIGKSGKTGFVTGPHLHFEIRKDGTPVNTRQYVFFNPDTTPKPPDSTIVTQTQIVNSAVAYGIDPFLAVAVAWVESKFYRDAQGDADVTKKYTSISNLHDGYCSFGLYQENICSGAGKAFFQANPDATWDQFINPDKQEQRFAKRVLAVPNRQTKSPGQIAAEAQGPADPAGYATLVDSVYIKLTGKTS